MSWESTIEPGRVSLRIRLRTTAGPGRFQSSGSTSQRIMSYPNSSWIHRFSRSVIDPYGGRSNVGLLPIALLIASSVRCNWLRTLSCDILAKLGCDQLWLAISCPSRAARATIAGSLGGTGLFSVACFSTFGDTALGAASIEWAGILGLVAGAVWAASATAKLNVAAQP